MINKNDNKDITIYRMSGTLELKDDTTYTYILKDSEEDEVWNLSEALDASVGGYVYIEINDGNSTVLKLEDYEVLYKKPDQFGINSWFLQGENIDEKLFDKVGKHLNVTINVMRGTRQDGDK